MSRTGRPPLRTPRGDATRARIVRAAADLMHSNGVAATSLDAVLAASDASKSQLYHYFADKDDLVLAVVQRQTECVLEAHSETLRALRSITGLRAWRNAVVTATRRSGCAGGCPLGSLVSELAETPRSRAALAASFALWQEEFRIGLESIQARTERTPRLSLDDLAVTLLTALQGGLLLAQTTRSTRPLELALDAAIDRVEAEFGSRQ
jgi:TetR/AcrR family transcriptional repressor of nem operon